jgi:hypothetical protein
MRSYPLRAFSLPRSEVAYSTWYLDLAEVKRDDGEAFTLDDVLAGGFFRAMRIPDEMKEGDLIRCVAADRSFDCDLVIVAVGIGVMARLRPGAPASKVQAASRPKVKAEAAA